MTLEERNTYHVDKLPKPLMNFARRMNTLGPGRYQIEYLITKRGNVVIVVDGKVPEELGNLYAENGGGG